MYDIIELNKKLVGELREIADKLEIKKADKLKKEDLIYQILDQQAINPKAVVDVKKEANPQPKKPIPATNLKLIINLGIHSKTTKTKEITILIITTTIRIVTTLIKNKITTKNKETKTTDIILMV